MEKQAEAVPRRVHWREWLRASGDPFKSPMQAETDDLTEEEKPVADDLDSGEKKYSTDRAALLKAIAGAGYTVTYSSGDTLVLDMDAPFDAQALHDKLENFCWPVEKAIARPSFREGCWHVIVKFVGVYGIINDPWKRCAIQMYLGSDPKKEYLSWLRISGGDTQPSLIIDDAYALANEKQIYPLEANAHPSPEKVDPNLTQIDVPGGIRRKDPPPEFASE